MLSVFVDNNINDTQLDGFVSKWCIPYTPKSQFDGKNIVKYDENMIAFWLFQSFSGTKL